MAMQATLSKKRPPKDEQAKPAYYGYIPMVLTVGIAGVAICALFSGSQRFLSMDRQDGAWWLGADLEPSEVATGVRIKRVWLYSPARTAGLKMGDVILRFDGTPVSTPAEVEAVLSGSPNETDLVILRDGRTSSLPVVLQEKPNFAMNIGAILLLLAAVFGFLYFTSLDRLAVVGCGAVLSILMGTGLGFYSQGGAFAAIRMSPLALLLGMGLITAALEETGFFAVMARNIVRVSQGDRSRLMVLLCVGTFFSSGLISNLTTILVILPVTLNLSRELAFDPTPFITAEIICSNLGGASSMVGDFGNMLVASEAGLHFHDFLLYMMPPCLVLLFITTWYMKRRSPDARVAQDRARQPARASDNRTEAPPPPPGGK